MLSFIFTGIFNNSCPSLKKKMCRSSPPVSASLLVEDLQNLACGRPWKCSRACPQKCRCADAEISSRNPMTICPEVDLFSTPSLLHRAAIDRSPSPLSLSDTWPPPLDFRLQASEKFYFAFSEACCTGTARRSQTPPTILSPEVYRHQRLLQC